MTTKKRNRDARKSKAACLATKHAAMKRDGWKNCWHCGVELNKEITKSA